MCECKDKLPKKYHKHNLMEEDPIHKQQAMVIIMRVMGLQV